MKPPNASPSLSCIASLSNFSEACAHRLVQQVFVSPLALEGAELVTFGEAEWLELRLEVDGLGCSWDDKHRDYFTSLYTGTSLRVQRFEVARMLSPSLAVQLLEFVVVETAV